jgi:gas vesicle protein
MMSRDDTTGWGGVLLAFLAGAVTGAAVALLFAPATGDETRQFLSDRAREGRERAMTAAREGRETLRRQKDQVVSAIDRGREAFDKVRRGEEPA